MNKLAKVIRAGLLSVIMLPLLTTLSVQAQSWPGDGVVRLVVPYPAGGVVDIIGRELAAGLQRTLPGTVVVENRAGAGGTVGAQHVSRADADGRTLLIGGAGTHAFAPYIYKDTLQYDVQKDFVPITQVTEGPLVLVVNASSPIKTLDDFMREMAARGKSVNYASNGTGTYPHLAVELLKQSAGFESTHIPYKGGGQALVALLASEVDFSLNHIPVVLGQIKAGQLRALATAGAQRSTVFPDLPTLKEAGFDVVASPWFGVFAPAGTSPDIIERVAAATKQAFDSPEMTQKMAAQGDEILVQGPKAFAEFQRAELEKWGRVIKAAGLSAR